jgi:hypothetical protein
MKRLFQYKTIFMIGIILSSFTGSASAAYQREAATSFGRNAFEDSFKKAKTHDSEPSPSGDINLPDSPEGPKLDAVGDISYMLILSLAMGYGLYVFGKFKTVKNKVQ